MKECYKPKTSDEIQKASEEYIFKTHIDDANVQDHFIAGAEWMQAKMQESNEGQALLYAVEKTAERTKREVIEKAVEWIKSQIYIENIFEYDEDNQPVRYVCASCCDTVDDFIEKFKQAME